MAGGPRMASKSVKLQRPDSGHRVQSLLKEDVGRQHPASFRIEKDSPSPESVEVRTGTVGIAYESGNAGVAAGPVGRNATAETDVSMRAEILSDSRARGPFAGISLEGSTIRPDNDANKRIYGEKISSKDIVIAHGTHVPPAAESLISTL